ncbi:MAG: molecular chaperone TorD family protein [bacterium]|nr:molecular chaperone TorD family protein [bacterium]
MTDDQVLEEYEQHLAAGMVVYADITRCFYYPEEELLTLLDSGEMERHLPLYRLSGIEPSEHFERIRQWRQKHTKEEAWLELKKEYTALFITARPKVPAPPYGSLYLESEGMVWGDTTREAVKLYMEAGLKVSEGFKDIPDHFAAEAEFVWYLIWEELKARGMSAGEGKSTLDMERASKMSSIRERFLLNHLTKWAPLFLDKVISSGSKSVFYREFSYVTKAFLHSEAERLTCKSSLT